MILSTSFKSEPAMEMSGIALVLESASQLTLHPFHFVSFVEISRSHIYISSEEEALASC